MVVTSASPATQGRQAVAEANQHLFDFGLTRLDVETQEIYAVGDTICELGTAELFTASGRVILSYRFMTLWKKEEGKWRVHRAFLTE